MGSEGVGGMEIHHSDCHVSQSAVSWLCCVHRFCQESARSKSGLENTAAQQNQLWLADELFLELGVSTAQQFFLQSSTWHLMQKLGDVVETTEFFLLFLQTPLVFRILKA